MLRYLFIVFIVMFVSNELLACSCVNTTEMELVDDAELVFVARITAAHEIANSEHDSKSMGVKAEFEIIEVLKGNRAEIPHVIEGGYGDGDCGLPFIIGRHILVHTDYTGQVNICNGTRYVISDNKFRKDPVLEKYRRYIIYKEPIVIEPVDDILDEKKNESCGIKNN